MDKIKRRVIQGTFKRSDQHEVVLYWLRGDKERGYKDSPKISGLCNWLDGGAIC